MSECEQCKRDLETVKDRPSMTAYVWDGEGDDPNRAGDLCDDCWEDYRAYWQERWDEYYAGCL